MRILLILLLFTCPAFSQIREAGPWDDGGTLTWDRFHRNDGANSDRLSGDHGNILNDVHWIGSEVTIGNPTAELRVFLNSIEDYVEPTIDSNALANLVVSCAGYYMVELRSPLTFGSTLGSKIFFYGNSYHIDVEPFTLAVVTDKLLSIKNDTGNVGWMLDADTGEQTLYGDIQAAGHSIRSASKGYFSDGVIHTIRPETTREELLINTEEGQEFYWIDPGSG